MNFICYGHYYMQFTLDSELASITTLSVHNPS